ncbi:MAG TPA: U32 family peptidase [Alphaproteobacteria bacterium]|nr:U32 family peptidase [Alphaproteobacteria bacterium]
MKARLTLGPLPFHWPAEQWRDFYFRIADEAPVDTVYLGEVVCAKRLPFHAPEHGEVIARLERAGKEVVMSTLALVISPLDRKGTQSVIATAGERMVEVNDIGGIPLMEGCPHVIGPFVGVYNEGTLNEFLARGAQRVCLSAELPAASVAQLADVAASSLEVSVFGRQPLAISARCYHARARGRSKNNCEFVCGEEVDGLSVETLDRVPFVTVDGPLVMSHPYLCLVSELGALKDAGVCWFRLSPHGTDMAAVASLYRRVLDGTETAETAIEKLRAMGFEAPLSNGGYYGEPGESWVAEGEAARPGGAA